MIKKLTSNPQQGHFLAYSFVFILYGSMHVGLGPLIPYLADAKGISET